MDFFTNKLDKCRDRSTMTCLLSVVIYLLHGHQRQLWRIHWPPKKFWFWTLILRSIILQPGYDASKFQQQFTCHSHLLTLTAGCWDKWFYFDKAWWFCQRWLCGMVQFNPYFIQSFHLIVIQFYIFWWRLNFSILRLLSPWGNQWDIISAFRSVW